MKVKYVGPYDAVDVAHLVGVKQGEAVEVSAELGKSLCEQDANWQPVTATEKKKEA